MTQMSYFHNGSMRGDGTYSPYTARIYSDILYKIFSSSRTSGVLTTGTAWNDLLVSSAGVDMEIDINSGNAFIGGIYYKSSATESIELNAGTNRWDIVVIRVDWESQTARLAVVQGEEATSPILPVLQQDIGTIYEFPLANVRIIGGAVVPLENVYDQRRFIPTAQDPPIMNIMPNSELFLGAHSGAGETGGCYAPAYWYTTTYSTGMSNVEVSLPEDVISRGNVIQISNGLAKLSTDMFGSRRSSSIWSTSCYFTFAFYMRVNTGTINLKNSAGTTLYTMYPSAEPILYLLRLSSWLLGGAQKLHLDFSGGVPGEYYLYPVTLSVGFIAAPFYPKHEIILGCSPTSENYLSRSTATDSSVYLFSTSAYNTPKNIYGPPALLARQKAKDSGSAGDDTIYVSLKYPIGAVRTELGRLPNDIDGHSLGWVVGGIDDKYIICKQDIEASGAGTMDIQYYVVGASI